MVHAAAHLLGIEGIRGLSLRSVAEQAQVALPTVQHHFSSLEALTQAACERVLLDVEQAPLPAACDAELRATISADNWLAQQKLDEFLCRRLGTGHIRTIGQLTAFAWLARRGRGRKAARSWVAARLHALRTILPPRHDRRFVVEVILGLELLSIGCADWPDLALLNREVLSRALGIADEQDGAAPFWFVQASRRLAPILAAEEIPRPKTRGRQTDMKLRLLAASVQVFAEHGHAAITHRAIAAQAGVSTSLVSYHFPTSALLLYGTYRLIHSRAGWPGRTLAPDIDPALAMALASAEGVRGHLLSFEALTAAAVEGGFDGHAWRMRLMRGGHFWRQDLSALSLTAMDFDRHVFSIWMAGAGLIAESCYPPEQSISRLAARIRVVRHLLGAPPVADHLPIHA